MRPQTSGPEGSETRRHLRGSSLLLAGRVIAIVINFLVQVLTVRFLMKGDYGAFAYAISIVSMGSILCQLGLNKGVARLVPIYHEKRLHAVMFGALFISTLTVFGAGSLLVFLAFALEGPIARSVAGDPLSVEVLLILISLCPMQALDDLFQSMLAIFSGARSIFFRRHLMAPLLRLAVVFAVLLVDGSVFALAWGYLATGALGTITYIPLVLGALRKQGLLKDLTLSSVRIQPGELFRSSLPMITSDIYFILLSTTSTLVLEPFRGTEELAEFRAVIPLAGMSLVVFQTLRVLYVPSASRLFARNDATGLNEIYWKSTIWITLLTFPVFAVFTFLAEPVTVFLFGSRYAGAGTFLAILTCGNFFNVAMGLKGDTLQVHGQGKFIAVTNLLSGAGNIFLNFLLVPSLGGFGAALATAGTVVFYNTLNSIGLFIRTGIRIQWTYFLIYIRLSLVIGGLALLWALDADRLLIAAAIAVATFALLRWSSQGIDLAGTFPEIARIPFLKRVLAIEPRREAGKLDAKEAVE